MFKHYSLHVARLDCSPESSTYGVTVQLEDDLSELLPYLNAVVGKAVFYPELPYLRFTRGGRTFVLHPQEILFSGVEDRQEAVEALESLLEFFRSIVSSMDEMEPSYERPRDIKVLDVYRTLPRLNCGDCGLPSCMAYAAALSRGELGPEACLRLCAQEYQTNRQALLKLLS